MIRRPPRSTLFPTRRSSDLGVPVHHQSARVVGVVRRRGPGAGRARGDVAGWRVAGGETRAGGVLGAAGGGANKGGGPLPAILRLARRVSPTPLPPPPAPPSPPNRLPP